jgi:hypothetical protein
MVSILKTVRKIATKIRIPIRLDTIIATKLSPKIDIRFMELDFDVTIIPL